jgi:hypothetical protein
MDLLLYFDSICNALSSGDISDVVLLYLSWPKNTGKKKISPWDGWLTRIGAIFRPNLVRFI